MSARLSAIVVGLFLSVSLFGPITIALNAVPVNFAIFAAAAAVAIMHLRMVQHGGLPRNLLYLFVTLMLVAALAAGGDIRIDLIGLLLLLPISFMLGIWVKMSGRIGTVMSTMLLVFIPIACYVTYQLSLNGFSYNTYMRWSNSAFKIGYLDFSLIGVVLFVYFATRPTSLLMRVLIAGPVLFTVLVSGARYSIVFILLFICFAMISGLRKANVRRMSALGLGVGIVAILIALGLVRPESYYEFFEYSVFRLTSALGEDRSIAARFDLIDRTFESSIQQFILGYGAGGSMEILKGAYPHNMLLEALLDGGFFAALTLAGFIATSYLVAFRHVPKGQRWVFGLALFLTGAFLKSFSLYQARILFFALGYMVAFSISTAPAGQKIKLYGYRAARAD